MIIFWTHASFVFPRNHGTQEKGQEPLVCSFLKVLKHFDNMAQGSPFLVDNALNQEEPVTCGRSC